jgi:hypothetical protein
MDPNAIVNLALVALNGILQLIASIKGQGGLTDDQIAAQVQAVTAGNDAAYQAIIAALKTPPPPTV